VAAYRWHLPDAVPFRDSLRVTIEHGTENSEVADYATMAYWYQRSRTRRCHLCRPPMRGACRPSSFRSQRSRSIRSTGNAAARRPSSRLPVPAPDRYAIVVYRWRAG